MRFCALKTPFPLQPDEQLKRTWMITSCVRHCVQAQPHCLAVMEAAALI